MSAFEVKADMTFCGADALMTQSGHWLVCPNPFQSTTAG